MDEGKIKAAVVKRYGEIAGGGRGAGCGCGAAKGCCDADGVERLVDYGEAGEATEPGADLGLGCGIPTRQANLLPGEVVLDLGSGAGNDAFIAARAVGSAGRVIGVDLTPAMIERARMNAARGGYANVEFRQGDIEALPVEDASVDAVISNCVVNLAPDKRRVYAEIRRVLKPGGRFLISDMVTFGPVPEAVRHDMELWAGCVAGAMDREECIELIRSTGFVGVRIAEETVYDAHRGINFGLASVSIEGKNP